MHAAPHMMTTTTRPHSAHNLVSTDEDVFESIRVGDGTDAATQPLRDDEDASAQPARDNKRSHTTARATKTTRFVCADAAMQLPRSEDGAADGTDAAIQPPRNYPLGHKPVPSEASVITLLTTLVLSRT